MFDFNNGLLLAAGNFGLGPTSAFWN